MSKRCCTVVRFEVNLSDFCRYYQQPTNNTPELALRIGYMQQNLPHLLLIALCFAQRLRYPKLADAIA